MIAALLLTSALALSPSALDGSNESGWYGLKFKGIRSMPSVPLRHENGLPDLLLVHEPTQTRVYGLDDKGASTSLGKVDEKGRPIGTWKFFEGGQLRWEVEIGERENRASSSICKKVKFEFGRDAGPLFGFSCLDDRGQVDGLEEVLDLRGAVRVRGANSAGERTGPWLTYAPNRQPQSFAVYVAGKLDGEYQRFSPEGPGLTVRGEFRGGKAVGTWRYTCADGVPRERAFSKPTEIVVDEWQHECDAKIRSK